jgi:multidrug efflux pump subunit AcrB
VELRNQIKNVPGAADVFIQQAFSAPEVTVDVDRLKAQQLGLIQKDVADNVVLALSGRAQTAPNFWMDPQTGVSYPVVVQVPQYRLHNFGTLSNTPVTAASSVNQQLLGNVSHFNRSVSPLTVSHFNALPVMDVYANTEKRDLGGVARDVQKIIDAASKHLPAGTRIELARQVQTMNSSFLHLGLGIIAAIILVYLLMALNFQSWSGPFVILMALPGAFAGIVWILYLTQTTFSVPALMGAIMTMGVATANSILVVTFANQARADGKNAIEAALEAVTAAATCVHDRAGNDFSACFQWRSRSARVANKMRRSAGRSSADCSSTIGTLFMVPAIYSLLCKHAPVDYEKLIEDETRGHLRGPQNAA